MLPSLIFCTLTYLIITHQSPQSDDSTARTWLRYLLFLAPIAQAITLYTAGTAAFLISFLVGIFAAYLTAGSNDDAWINGMFASSLILPFALAVLHFISHLADWQWFNSPLASAFSQFLIGYCTALFNFMPIFQGICDQLSD